jgi:hypothetical protein
MRRFTPVRRRFHRAIAALALPFALSLPAACGDLSDNLKLCGQIPEDGCPIGRGGTCADTTCVGLYDCVEGAWTLVTACPGGTGGAGGGTPDAGGGGDCEKVVIDHTDETGGCVPDLQNPDCPAVAAETCVASACLTDCVDFYLCKQDGWALVAYCNEDGEVVLSP